MVAKGKNNCGIRPETLKIIEFNRKETHHGLWKKMERTFNTLYEILQL